MIPVPGLPVGLPVEPFPTDPGYSLCVHWIPPPNSLLPYVSLNRVEYRWCHVAMLIPSSSAILPAGSVSPSTLNCMGLVVCILLALQTLLMTFEIFRQGSLSTGGFLYCSSLGCVSGWMLRSCPGWCLRTQIWTFEGLLLQWTLGLIWFLRFLLPGFLFLSSSAVL